MSYCSWENKKPKRVRGSYLTGQCMIWTVDHTLSHIIPLSKLERRSYLCTTIKNKTKSVIYKNKIILDISHPLCGAG